MAELESPRESRPSLYDALPLPDARRVWAILVNHAGASDTDSNWVSFRQWFDRAIEHGGDEFRFIGALGFGGKFWLHRDGCHVSCYREDLTTEREGIIAETNLALDRLMDSL